MMRSPFAIAFAALLCGCAAAPAKQDPLEPMNRAVFTFNEKADQFVLKPVAQAYKAVTPAPVRTGVGNFFGNISDVLTFANDLLQGKPKEAIPRLEAVQAWYPRANVDASHVLGVCYIQTMRYDDARKAFATMYDVPADSAAAHLFNARMLLRQGYDPVAEQEAKQAVALDPKLPLAHRMLGELYLFKSRIPEAATELKAELAINPSHAATYYTLADAYTRLMQWDDAERLLQRSIWLDSSASGPYILMGKVLMHKKDYVLAERTLRRALNMDPNNYLAHYLLGQALRATDRADEAEREMKRSQELQASQTHGKVEVQQ